LSRRPGGQQYFGSVSHGGVAERTNAAVLKTVGRREASRGFESLPLRLATGRDAGVRLAPVPEHDTRAIHCAPGEGVTVKNPLGGPLTFKVRAEQTGGALTAFESSPAAGEGPPLHLHTNADEVLYPLEGTFRFKLDGELHDAPPGSFVFIPRGVPHTWQNVGNSDARLLVIFTPAAMETFFERFGELPDDASVPEAFRTLGGESGMDVVGPPLAESDPL
jgi:quercetin dioxygenase-like cupin family protein